MRTDIPFEIDAKEILVRGIFHPMFYSISKQKLKGEAFLPPPNKNDVSLLRRHYTNDDFCKRHSANLNIANNSYCGLATFHSFHVDEINGTEASSFKVELKATPLNEKGEYIDNAPVLIDSAGLPMHADLLYPSPLTKGQPATAHRKFAEQLAKIANFYLDSNPTVAGPWVEGELIWTDRKRFA